MTNPGVPERRVEEMSRTLEEIDALYAEGWVWFTEQERRGVLVALVTGVPDPEPPEIVSARAKLRGDRR